MTAIERPTPVQMTRRGVVLAAAVFAVVIAEAQMLMGWGQTAAEFAADSDATLKVAGYAFSIWAVIYVAILIYAVRQAITKTAESTILNKLGWPSAIAFAGIGLWIVAAAFDWEAATIVLIFGSAAVLLAPMLMNARHIRALPRRDMDRMTVVWPLSLLAGWLTIAAPVNLLTVATGDGVLPAGLSPTTWAILAVVLVTLAALAVTWRLRSLVYALPIAWGLLGVFVAETERNTLLATAAIAAAGLVLVGAVILTFKLRPSVER
ncbi:hypothetical protein [Brevundimonas sp. Root1279]|uniref:hypothetical protein n=1 Tax=Brevundimonas sp. Root1279 TaxID=1736443 RepID=UPI0006F786D3|nr:hypothetical protein [Brevundimonas sp. Root1279]KQW78880.1 hypothetical protein ASC65_16375 [Brevundimonas sp. Root1279]